MNILTFDLEKIVRDSIYPAFVLSKDKEILLCNEAFSHFLGRPKEEILGRYCYEIVHGLKESPEFCPLKEVCPLSGCDKELSLCPTCHKYSITEEIKGLYIREFWEPRINRYLRVSILPLYDLKGELAGYLHFIEDQTEKIRLFEDAVPALVITTPEGDIVRINKRAKELFRIKDTNAFLKEVKAQYFWVDTQKHEKFLQLLKEAKEVYNFETELRDFEGNHFYVLISSKLYEEKGVSLIYSAIEDVTNYLKAKEEALDIVKKILDFLPLGIAVIDDRDRVIFVNPKFLKLTGYSQEEILGASLHQLLVADEKLREAAKYVFEEISLGRRSYLAKKRVEFIAKRKDGSTFPVEVYFEEFYLNGKRYFIGTLQDITERKFFEERLLKEEKEFVIEKIAGGLAHDLNNLLMIVKGYLELLAERSSRYSEKERDYIEKLLYSFDRMKNLVSELFILSKGEFQTTEVVLVNNFLQNWIPFFLQGTAIKIHFELEPDLRLPMKESHFLTLIQNLVINAKEAMENVGELTVKAYKKDTELFIEIIDSGEGIPSHILEKIFEPGFTTKPHGSGLGLYVVKRIMDMYGGEVKILSEPKRGTKVILRFPLSLMAEKIKVGPLELKGDKGYYEIKRKIKLLILDDEEEIRSVLKEFLTEQGFEVDTAEDGDIALEKFLKSLEANQPFTHLLLDLTVPKGKGGVYFLKNLMEKDISLEGYRVIFMTGFTEKEIQEEAKGLKVDFVLFKPFSLYRVLEILKEL